MPDGRPAPRDPRRGPRTRSPSARRRTCSPAAPTSWSRSTSATAARRVVALASRRRARGLASPGDDGPARRRRHLHRARWSRALAGARCPPWPRPPAPSARRRSATPAPSAATSAPARRPATRCPVLAALDAADRASRSATGARVVPVDEFLVGPKRTALAARRARRRGARCPLADGPQEFLKVGVRNAMVIAVADLALVVDRRRTVQVAARLGRADGHPRPRRRGVGRRRVDWTAARADPASPTSSAAASAAAARPIDDHRVDRRVPPPRRRGAGARQRAARRRWPPRERALHAHGQRRPTTRSRDAWLGESLLYVLRERLGLPGAKGACEQGECGSCSVLLDGALVCSCLVLRGVGRRAARSPRSRACSRRRRAHRRAAGVRRRGRGAVRVLHPGPRSWRCTTCSTATPSPTELEVREALSGNLCRCTGYGRIFAAVEAAAASARGRRR